MSYFNLALADSLRLQWVLQDYSALSMGDTIEIVQQGKFVFGLR